MNNQEIFTHNNDKDRMPELIKLLGSREAVLIVGAGSSKRVGYPLWPELLKKLENLATQCGVGFKPDEKQLEYQPLEYAEKIRMHIEQKGELTKYYALIDREFEPKKYTGDKLHFHKTLVRLGLKGILTTNYDVVLEDALKDIGDPSVDQNSFVVNKNTAGQVHRFFLTMSDPNNLGVAHLHGIYNDPERIILSSKDYEREYDSPVSQETSNLNFIKKFWHQMRRRENFEWTLHRKFLWAVLATCRVVFVGFSLKDPYFIKILKTVNDDLWRWGRPVHFAIMSISTEITEDSKTLLKAQELKDDYGIETLFYSDTDGTHEGLEKLVYEIAEELGISVPSDTTPPELPSESEDELNKVKQMSQRMEGKISNEN